MINTQCLLDGDGIQLCLTNLISPLPFIFGMIIGGAVNLTGVKDWTVSVPSQRSTYAYFGVFYTSASQVAFVAGGLASPGTWSSPYLRNPDPSRPLQVAVDLANDRFTADEDDWIAIYIRSARRSALHGDEKAGVALSLNARGRLDPETCLVPAARHFPSSFSTTFSVCW